MLCFPHSPSLISNMLTQTRNNVLLKLGISLTLFLGSPFAAFASPVALDQSFNGTGKLITSLGNYLSAAPMAMDIQPDGKIVIAAHISEDNISKILVLRFMQNGVADDTFGTNGHVITDYQSQNIEAEAVAIQTNGKILIGGTLAGTVRTPLIIRYNSNGTLDGTFGTGGFAQGVLGSALALVLQSDGKIIIAGHYFNAVQGRGLDFFVERFNINGTPDISFDGDGRAVTSVSAGDGADAAHSLALQADGKVVAAGEANSRSALVRYMPDGSLDTTFDGDGIVVSQPGGGFVGEALFSVGVRSDGKIVASGTGSSPGISNAILRCYNAAGNADPAFGNNGFASNSSIYTGRALKVQLDNQVVIGGSSGPSPNYHFAMARYRINGSVDLSFGPNGIVSTPMGSQLSEIRALSLQTRNIVAMGRVQNGSSVYLGLARYFEVAQFDFDGDGRTDIGIFRPNAAAEWWVNRSSTGPTFALQFGASTDLIAPADYTGDGKADITFYRPSSGEWYVLRSEDFSFFALPFGTNGDVPVPADYDADGKADFAVFRPSNSIWYISQSSGAPTRIEQFGANGDQPVVSDYDGDGKADNGIFRPAATGGEWWINRSTAGLLAMQFGASTDKPVQGDYTGDGKTDIAIWRPSTGQWLIVRSEDFSFYGFPFGTNGDVIAPGDYDGDGKFDPTVFRPSSATWFIARTTAGTQIVQFGANGDRPIPNAFVP
jgi:uncharacterized delta-60 repeat protein